VTSPSPPSQFEARPTDSSTVELKWGVGSGAQKTKVQRGSEDYPSGPADGVEVYFDSGSAAIDVGLEASTTYYYRAWSWTEDPDGGDCWSPSHDQDVATTYPEGCVGLFIELAAGWNLVSIPLDLAEGNDTVEAVFRDRIDAIYTWNARDGCYDELTGESVIGPELGYWVAVTDENAGPLTVTGMPHTEWADHPLFIGWNMIGSVYGESVLVSDLTADPDTLQRGAVYHWDPVSKSYGDACDTIVEGEGYWIACTSPCNLTVGLP
jgi:hypothetical protein